MARNRGTAAPPAGPPAAEQPPGLAMADPVTHTRSSSVGFLLDSLRRRKAGRVVLSLLTVVLFLAGVGLFTYPFFTDLYTKHVRQRSLAEEFQRIDVTSFEDWETQVAPGRPLTRLIIPALGVDTLVVEGTSPDALRAGAGHYPNTPLPGQPGNVAIAGHRTTYGKPFNELDTLEQGDVVWLATPIGDYRYEVTAPPEGWSSNPFITTPTDWRVIEQSSLPMLTLTTCHPKGSAAQRLVVRADLAESMPPGSADGEIAAARAAAAQDS